ncbi:MAG: hydrogenase small subunit [Syntrophobacteraceae bacterium]
MAKILDYPLIWLQGAGCTGCSISMLNAAGPTVKNLLLDELIPGNRVSLRFHTTLMAGCGEEIFTTLETTRREHRGGYVLVLEGAIPTRGNGRFGSLGERQGTPVPIADRVAELGASAWTVIALGTCAAYGGIAAAVPDVCRAVGASRFFRSIGIETPLINVPGCPPHPDWFMGALAGLLLNGVPKPEELDEFGRLKSFYGKLVHENCQRRAYYDEKKFAANPGEEGCLYELGCKGPVTHADCPVRLWNGGINWCAGCGSMCIGCASPWFPDLVSPLYEKTPDVALPNIGAAG